MNALLDDYTPEIPDPPPPYPDPQRRPHRSSRSRLHSVDSDEDRDADSENTPFLLVDRVHATRHSRQRASNYGSGNASFTQALLSLFRGDDDEEVNDRYAGDAYAVDDPDSEINCPKHLLRSASWKRYFVPLRRRVYYRALLHLLLLNFPYTVIAWVYLFVFTVTGTTTLIALPLGAILCFLDLLGARAFSRGELYLQARFHQIELPSYQPRPLFTRLRESPVGDQETGRAPCSASRFRSVKDHSFYRNTYAMFTDPTSYQALFYFLVIKPAITLLITILLIAFGVPSLILILPVPAVLRAVRKIGVWQANIAVEGLYHPVR